MYVCNYNISILLNHREITGKFYTRKWGKTNLIRSNLNKLPYEQHSIYPVEVRKVSNNYRLCILFDYENDEDFEEDLHFCRYDFDAVLFEYLFKYS